MSIYILDSNNEDSEVRSHLSPTLILQDVPLHGHLEEVHSLQVIEKIPSERHSVIHEEENPSNFYIEEIFDSFTFNLYKKEVSHKRTQNEKQNDGTMKEIQEDEVLSHKIDEDPSNNINNFITCYCS